MNLKVSKKLITQKTKDYSFTVIFFTIFTFFALFVIRPNVTTVFSLQKDLEELKQLGIQYDKSISDIMSIQSSIEANRDSFYLLDEAMPSTPKVNQVVDDINNVASRSGVKIVKLDIGEVGLKQQKNKSGLKKFNLNMEVSGDFKTTNVFLTDISRQRRLKLINSLTIKKEKESSNSAFLRVYLEIIGYYL